MSSDIEIHIGEIFLDSLPAGDLDALRAAIVAGLEQRIAVQGWPHYYSLPGHHDLVRPPGPRSSEHGAVPGDQIAGLIYEGLRNDTQRQH